MSEKTQPFINFKRHNEDDKVDFDDRSQENNLPIWKNFGRESKKAYYRMKLPDGSKWSGWDNKYYKEPDEDADW